MPKRLSCLVPGCDEDLGDGRAVLFQFPKNDLSVLQAWIHACGSPEMEDLDKARICSRHFQESDFVRDIRNELLNIPQRKLLSSSAIPSRNLPTEVTKVDLTHVSKEIIRSTNPSHNVLEVRPIKRRRKLASTTGTPQGRKLTCCVADCPSPNDASFHKLPKDTGLKQLWLSAFKRKENINFKTAFVCDQHFLPGDFAEDVRHELLNLPLRKILRFGAVPSQNLTPPENELPNDWKLEWNNDSVDIITTVSDVDHVEVSEDFNDLIHFEGFDASTCTDVDKLRGRIAELERFILVQNSLIESLRINQRLQI